MNINYDEMLKDLERPQDEVQEIHYPEEEFKAIAGLMADLGYIHTKESLDALQAYMSGYGLLLTGDVGTGKTFSSRRCSRRSESTAMKKMIRSS